MAVLRQSLENEMCWGEEDVRRETSVYDRDRQREAEEDIWYFLRPHSILQMWSRARDLELTPVVRWASILTHTHVDTVSSTEMEFEFNFYSFFFLFPFFAHYFPPGFWLACSSLRRDRSWCTFMKLFGRPSLCPPTTDCLHLPFSSSRWHPLLPFSSSPKSAHMFGDRLQAQGFMPQQLHRAAVLHTATVLSAALFYSWWRHERTFLGNKWGTKYSELISKP